MENLGFQELLMLILSIGVPVAVIVYVVRALTKKRPSSTADELSKLHSLKERGILTEQEYEAQKKKLL